MHSPLFSKDLATVERDLSKLMIQKSNKLDNVPDKYHELNIFRTYDNQIQKTFLSYVYAADYDLMVESKINTKKARLNRSVSRSSPTVICIWKTILDHLKKKIDNLSTLQSIVELVEHIRDCLHGIELAYVPAYISIDAACDMFKRFIILVNPSITYGDNLGKALIKSGELAMDSLNKARSKVKISATRFIKNGSKILIHGNSRCVIECISSLKNATIYLTSGSSSAEPSTNAFGHQIKANILEFIKKSNQANSINSNKQDSTDPSLIDYSNHSLEINIIPDTAVAFYMNKVDFCLVGAEGVIENGGIINQIGTFQVALIAKQFYKPFYCASESYKFMRFYPLSQDDLRNPNSTSPLVDMTPPELITLFITDQGILTPGEVCDTLIKLYSDVI